MARGGDGGVLTLSAVTGKSSIFIRPWELQVEYYPSVMHSYPSDPDAYFVSMRDVRRSSYKSNDRYRMEKYPSLVRFPFRLMENYPSEILVESSIIRFLSSG